MIPYVIERIKTAGVNRVWQRTYDDVRPYSNHDTAVSYADTARGAFDGSFFAEGVRLIAERRRERPGMLMRDIRDGLGHLATAASLAILTATGLRKN